MRKSILLCCFAACVQIAFTQHKYIDSLQATLVNTSKPIDRFNTIVKISELHFLVDGGKFDSSTAIQLLKIAQQLKNDSLLAISYNWIGSWFGFVKGDNITALEYYFKAIPLAEAVRDKRRISSLYFDIGLVYFSLQNNEEAGRYIRMGGENLPDLSSPMYDYMLVQYQRNMAQYYLSGNQLDSALHHAQAFEETSRRIKSISFLYGAFYTNAQIYAKRGDKEMAELYFKKAIAIADSNTLSSNKLVFYQGYIPFLLDNKKNAEAHAQAEQLMDIATKDDNNNMKLTGAGFMRQVFDSLHQVDSAYYYARMEASINAAIFSQNNTNKIQSLAFNEKLRLMEDEAKRAAETEQRKENIQYVLIALGIITLLTLYLLLSRSFITNTRLIEFFGVIGLLIVFEFLNLLLHPFLEKITHHSPVLLLLALFCIAALLVPFHHKVEKWATNKLVEKNKKIRLAAARKTITQLEGSSDNL